MPTNPLRRWTILSALAALVVAPALALTVAAPADALQAPPVTPPKLNVPSSVISGAVGTGTASAASGAQLGGQIATAGGKAGTPAFPATSVTKVVGTATQVINAYQLGTFIGGAVTGAFGIDSTGTVCGGTGTDVTGTVLRTLAGVDCSTWSPSAGYTPNTDAVAGVTTDWLCQSGAAYGPSSSCAAVAGSQPFNGGTVYCLAYQIPTSGSQTPVLWVVTSTGYRQTLGSSIGTVAANSSQPCWGVATRYVAGALQPQSSGGYGVFTMFFTGHTSDTLAGFSASSTTGIQAALKNNTANPTRWKVCTITTTDGGSYSAQTANFAETDPAWPADNCPTIPAGKTAGHLTVTLNGGPQVLTLRSEDSSSAYQAAQTAYPNCANGTCTLDLLDGTGSCYSGDSSRCATWVTDPNRDTKYKCKYGTYDAPLKECFALGNAFDAAKVAAGNGIADPATGNDTGTQTSVKPDVPGAPDPADAGDTRQACFPTGWGAFNPLNWVLQPTKCALNWAFVPRKSQMDVYNGQIKDAVSRSAIGGFQASLSSWANFGFTDAGCSGVPIDIDMFVIHIHDHILAACPGDTLAPQASLTKTIVTAVVISAGVLACLRYLAQIFGFSGLGSIIAPDRGGKVNKGVKFQ